MTSDHALCSPPAPASNLLSAGFFARAAAAVAELARPTPQPDLHPAPVLVVDAYWQDLGEAMIDQVWPWHRLMTISTAEAYRGQVAAAWGGRAYHAAVLKATQGTGYPRRALAWFQRQWSALDGPIARELRFLRGAYHYLMFRQNGRRQADFYLDQVGGELGGVNDILPIVDIEFGNDQADNRKATRQQLVDCASEFTLRVRQRTGRTPILYGGSALASLRIKDRLGCRWLWPAAYSPTLTRAEATSIGWTLDQVIMWQYTDGKKGAAVTTRGTKLPIGVPGVGRLDCSVVTQPGGPAGARAALLGAAS